MAIEYFLKVDGIPGESLSKTHKEEIELHSWSWGAHNHASMHGSGLSGGKAEMAELTVSKPVDKASPKLLELLFNGKHINTATLSCQKSTGKDLGDYLIIKMQEIAVTSFQAGGSNGDAIGSESISFAFVQVEYDYKIQGKDGGLTAAGTAKYDAGQRVTS